MPKTAPKTMPRVPPEVVAEQYQLRATFFASRLEKLNYIGLLEAMMHELSALEPDLDWADAAEFGAQTALLSEIAAQGQSRALHFCHPDVLLSHPQFLLYYRCISTFSQKGLKTLAGVSSIERIEAGLSTLRPDQAQKLARTINENLCAIYAVALPSIEQLKGLMYATAGTSIDGSWRNKIGAEGERVVRTLFLKALLAHDEIAHVTLRNGGERAGDALNAKWLEEHTADLQSGKTRNGALFLFGSEPDIKLIAPNGQTVGGVEIKAGLDPAGALERLGAMMKSFENIRSDSSEAETILVASCITDEVDQRLRSMRGVRTFIMTDVIQNRKSQGTRLMNIMRGCIGLTQGYQ